MTDPATVPPSPPGADGGSGTGAVPTARAEAPSTRPPAVRAALSLANKVHATVREHGRTDLADPLAAEAARWQQHDTVVVVAGAQKRGKSSLINTLVNRPGLVPVDEDIATDTHIALRYGDQFAMTVRHAQGPPQSITPDQLGDYASVLGDPALRRGVSGVEVTLAHPLLQGLRLVDTPGVDSLTIGHKHATMSALHQADVLLFVLSGRDQPVQRHELEFLAEACRRVPQVAFVLTKIDDAPHWRELLDENRRRLVSFVATPTGEGRQFTPRDAARLTEAVWLPVSSRMADAAAARRERGEDARATQLLTRSGMADLAEFLRGTIRSREVARAAQLVHMLGNVLRELVPAQEDAVAGGSDDTGRAQRLEQLREEQEALDARRRAWQLHRAQLNFLGGDVAVVVRDRLEQMRREYDADLRDRDLRTTKLVQQCAEELTDSLPRSLEAAGQEILATADDRIRTDLVRVLHEMGLEDVEVGFGELELAGDATGGDRSVQHESFDALRDGVPAAMMASSLTFIGLHVALLGPLAPFVIGPALAFAVLKKRWDHQVATRGRQELRQLVAEVVNEGIRSMTPILQRAVAEQRTRVEQTVEASLAQARRALDSRVVQLGATAKQDAAARREAAALGRRRLDTLQALIAETASLEKQLQLPAPAIDSPGAPGLAASTVTVDTAT